MLRKCALRTHDGLLQRLDERRVLVIALLALTLHPPFAALQLLLQPPLLLQELPRLCLRDSRLAVPANYADELDRAPRVSLRAAEHPAHAAPLRTPEASAEVALACAPGARANKMLGVPEVLAPRGHRLEQRVLREVRHRDLVLGGDHAAGPQHEVVTFVVPDCVRQARVGHEGGHEVRGVPEGVVRVLEAVEDPDLEQPLEVEGV
mmetsp:Transcript_27781/g.78645  ORF Transcript_27781/g.78645 Transcript_27781/m.78645 type:complete len:206 (+) Transcript_27781:581-1198(+)